MSVIKMPKRKSEERLKKLILEAYLPNVVFDGWNWTGVVKAAGGIGYDRYTVRDAFPAGLSDVLSYFSSWIDAQMMDKLSAVNPDDLRIRERISTAVLARFEVLAPYKEPEKLALAYWSLPPRQIRAAKIAWRTADLIWDWAGDTAKDYNRYTKRTLLSGILASTLLVWLDDDSADIQVTRGFLDRRIENVMQLGRIIGKIKKAS